MDHIEKIIKDNENNMLGVNKHICSNLILLDGISSARKHRLASFLHSDPCLHGFLYFYI
jgi:hypothetical protein